MKKYFKYILYGLIYLILIFVFAVMFIVTTKADIIKPNNGIEPYQVVKIQLRSLKNNDDPFKNAGIEQTWEFAHPNNKKYTGPFKSFVLMIRNDPYNVLLNSKFFKIKVLSENKKKARIEVLLDSNNNRRYKIFWHLGRTTIDSKCQNCWMTLGVTQPFDMGVIY